MTTCARCRDAARAIPDSYCKPCRRELTREWRARNPDRATALAAYHNARRPRKGSRRFLRNLRATLATLEEVQS